MSTPLVYGHRGASADAPENTVEAFALARAQGAHGVELDVRRCRDGDMALHHDAELADGRRIVELTRADLPDTSCTLAEALDVCEGMVVNIEIKNVSIDPDHDPECRLADTVVALLHERGGRDRVIVSSFGLPTIDRVRAIDPDVPTGFLTFIEPMGPQAIELAARHGHQAIHPHVATVDEAFVELAHQHGLAVNVWTVDDPDQIRQLAAWGVDGIVTNVPAAALAALAT
ncbi:glycerophosphodiester phosphodiesterase [Acidimicrobiia bacterium EGI L10123]|uniref:glycerophosphodiester phosphodiesterase n=1 Tax=Salinilacustrithrix flava TaxID=2957203 RepID=UPI003D7C23ED|nr:glycerophosphodiester phosphodiesterase [Acidimicrobiia bacterium EGI L10123]